MMPFQIPPYNGMDFDLAINNDNNDIEINENVIFLDNFELFQNNPNLIPDDIRTTFELWTNAETQWMHSSDARALAIQSAADRVRLFNQARNAQIRQSISILQNLGIQGMPPFMIGDRGSLTIGVQTRLIGVPHCPSGVIRMPSYLLISENNAQNTVNNFNLNFSNPDLLTSAILARQIGETYTAVKNGILECVRMGTGQPPYDFTLPRDPSGIQEYRDGTKHLVIGRAASEEIPLVSVKRLPDVFGHPGLQQLEHIEIHGLIDLTELPQSLLNLPFLQELEVHNCPLIEEERIALDNVEIAVHCDSELDPLIRAQEEPLSIRGDYA